MNCKKCGAPLEKEDTFCKECGTLVENVALTENTIEVLDVDEKENSFIGEKEEPFVAEEEIEKESTNHGLFIGFVIGFMLMLFVVFMIFFFIKSQKQETKEEKPVISSTLIHYNGYEIPIDPDLQYDIQNGVLHITDADTTWQAQIGVQMISYEEVKNNINTIQNNYINANMPVTSIKENVIDGKPYIASLITMYGKKVAAVYTKASDQTVFYIGIYNKSNAFDENTIKTVVSVLKKAKVLKNEPDNVSLDMHSIGLAITIK